MTDRSTGPVYDPTRRPLRRAQAEDARFYDVLLSIAQRRIQALFDEAFKARRAGYRFEPNAISHEEAVRRLGYKPDAALIRVRKAPTPELPKPVEEKRKWWQR